MIIFEMKLEGHEKCCFCDNKETIHHLFFEFLVAQFIWRIVHIAFGLQLPIDMTIFFSKHGYNN
jgi:hypothetical protein